MRSLRQKSGAIICGVLAVLVLTSCAPAASRQGRDRDEEAKPKEARTIDAGGLKLDVPADNVLWPTVFPKDPGQPKYGGTVTTAYPGDVPSLDPSRTTSYLRSIVGSPTYDKLVTWEFGRGVNPENIRWVPSLAESWEVSKDNLSYTFKLRQGVKWPDVPPLNGREFTSDDVRFSYDYFTRDDSLIKSGFAKVDRIETPDKYTVVYRLKQRDRAFINTVGGPYNGFIVPKEVVERDGNLGKVMIGLGPFYNDDGYQPKVGIDFKRNPNYWRKDESGNKLPYLDGWKFRVIPDQSAQVAAFRTGKLDLGPSVFRAPSDVQNMMKLNPNVFFQETKSVSYSGIAFRHDRDDIPFKDLRVRRAMALAINYDEMAQTVYELPKALNTSHPVRGLWFGENDDPASLGEWYLHNPERAKKLLAEAGYPNGFKTNYQFFEYGKYNVTMAEMYKSYWAAIGIDAEIKSMDYTVYRNNTDRAGWDEVIATISFPTYDDVDNALNFVYYGGLGNQNNGKVNDPEINQWVDKFWASDSDTEREQLYKNIRRQWLNQVYTIPHVVGTGFFAFQPWVRNYQPNSNFNMSVYDHALAFAWVDDSWRK